MTTETRNEAAERPYFLTDNDEVLEAINAFLSVIRAVERRATVERIGQTLRDADMALKWSRPDRAGLVSLSDIADILTEEAAR